MSESKKKLYKRETCMQAVKELIVRAEEINADKADYHYYNKLKDVILFGSLVNTNNDKVHDIDIAAIQDNIPVQMHQFHLEHPSLISDWFWDECSEWFCQRKYLKNGRKMFSIHSNVMEGKEIKDIATSDKHIYLVRDHKITADAQALLKG